MRYSGFRLIREGSTGNKGWTRAWRDPALKAEYDAVVIGGDLDLYASYAARGNLPMVEHVMEAGMTLMPMIGRTRVLRSWGGLKDMSPDRSPIIDRTRVDGLFLNCGWSYGGGSRPSRRAAGAWRT